MVVPRITYSNQWRWTEAEKLGVDVLETRKRVLRVEPANTQTMMTTPASTYKRQGRHEDAIDLLRKAERLRRRILGSNHYLTMGTMQALQTSREVTEKLQELEAEAVDFRVEPGALDRK
jgi:hypothetical protein